MTTTARPDKRTEAESVVAGVLKLHMVRSRAESDSYSCTCGNLHSIALAEVVAHQATAVMFALNAWVAA